MMTRWAAAQVASQPAAASATNAKGELGSAYVDGSFGFSIRYPVDSVIEREKRVLDTTDLELVRFVQMQYTWSLVVRLSTAARPLTPEAIMEGITQNLTTEHQEPKVIRQEAAQIAAREGVRYAARFTADGREWLRQQAVIRRQPTEYYALILITPWADNQDATAAFERIVASFEILRSELMQERINAALKRGEMLRQSLTGNKARLKALAKQDGYLRVVQENKEIGFLHIHQEPGRVDYHEGASIRQWGWLFRPDGSITQLQHDMFQANDLDFAQWDNRVRVLTPGPPGQPPQITLSVEHALSQGDKLLVSYRQGAGATEMKEKVIEIEPSFVSPAWFVLFPQLVDLKQPELYAFSTYNSDRHGLILRALEVIGPTQVIVDGRRMLAVKIEDSEGRIPPINEVDVDEAGRILRVSAGPLEMLATTQRYVEQNYDARVNETLETMRKYSAKGTTSRPHPK